jgi:O-antigen ligase
LSIGLTILLQLVPLSPSFRTYVSPKGEQVVERRQELYGALQAPSSDDAPAPPVQAPRNQPISISPSDTRVGLLLFGTLSLFLLGAVRLLSVTGARPVVRALVGIGLLLAIVGIAQYVLTLHDPHPLVYGFWKPESGARAFGPFINPNHFAGWMLMVLPLTLALFYDTLQQTLEEAHSYTRNRIALTNSPRFGALIILGFSAVVMGLSLVMTRSRSGLAAFVCGSTAAAWMVFRRQRSRGARAAVVASFSLLLLGSTSWAGLDALSSKSIERGAGDLSSFGNRVTTWTDALRIARDFPLAGTGFNTFGTAMFTYQTATRETHYQEAHNDYLQIAAEGGLLVSIPVIITLMLFMLEVRRRFREAPKGGSTYWLRVGAVIGLSSVALQSLVEFSLQMPGNAALFAVLAAIAIHQSPNLRRE